MSARHANGRCIRCRRAIHVPPECIDLVDWLCDFCAWPMDPVKGPRAKREQHKARLTPPAGLVLPMEER